MGVVAQRVLNTPDAERPPRQQHTGDVAEPSIEQRFILLLGKEVIGQMETANWWLAASMRGRLVSTAPRINAATSTRVRPGSQPPGESPGSQPARRWLHGHPGNCRQGVVCVDENASAGLSSGVEALFEED